MQELVQFDWPVVFNLPLLGRLLLAAVLGGLIGLERELSGKPAGLRTNLLICVGAALLMELSINVATIANVQNVAAGTEFRADPARIAAQIVSGIGFLGAGTILVMRGHVVGLTTAATIWVVAAIGMAVGARAYVEAAGATVLVYIALSVLNRVEDGLQRRRAVRRYRFRFDTERVDVDRLERMFAERKLSETLISATYEGDDCVVAYQLVGRPDLQEGLAREVMAWPGVREVTRTFAEV